MREFREVEILFKKEIRAILAQADSPAIGEAAFPAYAHRNPLIGYLFWNRLRVAYTFCLRQKGRRLLDFGCGPAVLTYALAQRGFQITALDTDLSPSVALRQRIAFPESIRFLETDLLACELEPDSIDMIMALDVLEHIDDLKPYLDQFTALLAPGGVILVSAPTENWFYRVGRKLAGKRFTGDYHASGAAEVRMALEHDFVIERVATLVRPIPLFELFSARPRARRR
jgi:2-polyprenyl-3-methyl-5-hydroxy-6-metoxy-1,4-benzoquinol methylase